MRRIVVVDEALTMREDGRYGLVAFPGTAVTRMVAGSGWVVACGFAVSLGAAFAGGRTRGAVSSKASCGTGGRFVVEGFGLGGSRGAGRRSLGAGREFGRAGSGG